MKSRFPFLPAFAILALGNLPAAEVAIPLTEDYLPAGRVSAYLADAQDFLRKNPKDPYAPRLTQDLLMVAKATGKDKIAEEARRSLLFRYVNSLQAGHLLTSLGSDPKALRGFLLQEADRVGEAEPDFPTRFCRCVLTAVRRNGPKLLEDNAFRLRLLLLAEAAGVPNLRKAAIEPLRNLKLGDEPLGRVVAAVLSSKTALDKLFAIHAVKSSDARFVESFYLSRLDDKQSKLPAVVELLAKRAIFGPNKKPTEGIVRLEALPNKQRKEPRLICWKAKALLALDRPREARKVLAAVQGSDPWAKAARSLADGLEHAESRRNTLIKAILGAVGTFSKEVEAIRVEATYRPSTTDDQPALANNFYLGLSTAANALEVQFRRGETLVLAYRTEANSSALYSQGQDRILHYAASGAVPIPNFALQRDPEDGTFSFNFGTEMGASVEQAANQGDRLLDNPYLATPAGLGVLLLYTLSSSGAWLPPPSSERGVTRHSIRFIDSEDPVGKILSLGLSSAGELRDLRYGDLDVHSIRYGPRSLLENAPAWPKLPVEQREEFDFVAFMGLLASLSKLATAE